MRQTDLCLLRWHIEAVWGLPIPDLGPGDIDVPVACGPTPWRLYVARTPVGEVRVWRDVPPPERAALALWAAAALDGVGQAPGAPVVEREVVLRREERLAAGGWARALGSADAALLDAFEPGETAYWLDPRRGPLFGVVRGGRLLSVAHSSRRTPYACELGINTLPDARRLGFARACVLAWADAVAGEGLEPLYSARWTNGPSLALARACGYRAFAHAVQVGGAMATG